VQVTIEDLSPVKKKIGVALPDEDVRAEIDEAYRGLQQRARIKGFRPGRVPRAILERYYGDQVRSEVIGKLIQDSYARALEEHKLHAVTRPEIVAEEVKPGAGLSYSATIEIKPSFDVGEYEGIEVERAVAPVDDAAVDAQIERFRQSLAQFARREDRDVVEHGDLVEISYTGVVEGRALPGASAEHRVIEVGAETFPPPFDERLVGMKVGDSAHIEVTYPEQHHSPEIAGKKVTFRVEVKAVGRKELPALDDEFAKDHGECGSLVELRDKVRRALEESAGREADEAMRSSLMKVLLERNPIDVPEGLVARRFESMAHEIGLPEHSHDSGHSHDSDAEGAKQLDEIRGELRRRARESVHSSLVLERFAVQQHLEVKEEEIDERIARVLRSAARERDRLAEIYRTPEARRDVRERIAQEKALDWLVAHAKVKPGAQN
jgi:trigger factor